MIRVHEDWAEIAALYAACWSMTEGRFTIVAEEKEDAMTLRGILTWHADVETMLGGEPVLRHYHESRCYPARDLLFMQRTDMPGYRTHLGRQLLKDFLRRAMHAIGCLKAGVQPILGEEGGPWRF
jgi:hypothetical protein